jgi:hydrogenase expression/formation protein HypE
MPNDETRPIAAGAFSCPIPLADYPNVLLAHGGGGKLTQQLIEKMFRPLLSNPMLDVLHDGAVFETAPGRLAFTTDSYVVNPLFFPGGDIGSLAVNGTVNDLAMCGARPMYLALSLIIEEGMPMEDLWKVARSVDRAAREAGVRIVTGDTKVVDRGKGDRLFVNTSGIGMVEAGLEIAPSRARAGDCVLVSGTLGDHGIAIMAAREGLEFQTNIESDSAPLHGLVASMLKAGRDIHVLRDPTRGGLASSLNEIASAAGVGIEIDEEAVPVLDGVRGACEILGIDYLYAANEGKLVAVVPAGIAGDVLSAMRDHPLGAEAVLIGKVVGDHPGRVVMNTPIGGTRILDMMSGEQLPRIC